MNALNRQQEQEDQLNAWEAAVSTWVDGEADIRSEELDSPYGRQVWDTYHLIGDVMRTEALAIRPSERFYARLSKAIDDEPTVLAPHAVKGGYARRYAVSGLVMAAAVASVIWGALPYLSSDGAGAGASLVATVQDDRVWHDYVDAHRDLIGVNPIRQVSFDGGAVGQ